MAKDVFVSVLVKGQERYVFVFTDEYRRDACRTVGRFAADSSLSMTWKDAKATVNSILNARAAETTRSRF